MEYIKQYELLHAEASEYGMSSIKYVPEISLVINYLKPKTVLDYGCGKSFLVNKLSEIHKDVTFYRYDPAITEISTLTLDKYDLIINTDVLEHVPEEYFDEVLKKIANLSDKAFFVLHHTLANQILPNGENAHCTVRPPHWYYKKFLQVYPDSYPLNGRGVELSALITFKPNYPFLLAYSDIVDSARFEALFAKHKEEKSGYKEHTNKALNECYNKLSDDPIARQGIKLIKRFTKRQYLFYSILSKLCFGKSRKRFKLKKQNCKELLLLIADK